MAFLDDYDLGETESPMDIDKPKKKESSFLDDYDIPDDGMPSARQVAKPAQIDPEQGDVAAGWDAGWEGYKSLGNLAKAAFGQMTGNDEMQAEGLADAKKNEAAAAEYGKGHITKVEDVNDVGDFIDYAQYGLATLIPYALESMGASIIGGVVGGATAGPAGAGAGAAAGFIGRSAVKSMVKEYAKGSLKGVSKKKIEGMVKQDMLDYAGGRMKDKATKKLIESSYKRAAANVGAKAGAFASGARMGFGDVYGNTVEAGDPSPYLSAALAVPYGLLDMMPEAMGLDRIMARSTDGLLKRVGKGVAAQMPAEGLTELAQEEINIRTQAGLNPEYDPYSDEANSIRLNSLILGAMGGGVFGAMSGGLQRVQEEGAGGLSPIELQRALNHPDSPQKERMRALYKIEASMAVNDPEAAQQWRTFAEGRIKEGKPVLLTPDEMEVATDEILRQQEATENLDKDMVEKQNQAGRKSAFEDVGEFVGGKPAKKEEAKPVKEKDPEDIETVSENFDVERKAQKEKERKSKTKEELEAAETRKTHIEEFRERQARADVYRKKQERVDALGKKSVKELRKDLQARNPGKKFPVMGKESLVKALMEKEDATTSEVTREDYHAELLGMKKKQLREIAAEALPKHYKSKKKSAEELANDIASIEFPSGKPGENDHIWDPRIINDPEIMGAVRGVVGELSEENKPQFIKTFNAMIGGSKDGKERHTGYIKSPSMNKLISDLEVDDADVFMKEQKDAIIALDKYLKGGRTPGPRAQKIISALLDKQQEDRYEGQVVEHTGRQPRPPAGTKTTPATMEDMEANSIPGELETDEGAPPSPKTVPTDEIDVKKLRSIKELRRAAEAANPNAAMDVFEKEMSTTEEAKKLRGIIKAESERRAAERGKEEQGPIKEGEKVTAKGYEGEFTVKHTGLMNGQVALEDAEGKVYGVDESDISRIKPEEKDETQQEAQQTKDEEKGEKGGKEEGGETKEELKARTKKESKGKKKWKDSDREDRAADLDYVGVQYIERDDWVDKKWDDLNDDIRNRLSNKALGRNLEHLRNEGEVLDEEFVFEDIDWGPIESSEPIDEGILVEGMDKDAWSLGINEDAERFADPQEKLVNIEAQEKAKIKAGAGFATKEEAKETIDGWIADAKEDRKNGNTNRYILSLFDHTGNWSKPWLDAGYNVLTFDIQNGQDVLDFSFDYFTENWDVGDVYGILAACPCTDFTSTSSGHWKGKDAGGDTELSKRLVFQTLETINHFKPKFWTIENPPGRIERMTGLPKARAQFQPHNFGHDYTKRTKLWGNFNADMPTVNAEPTQGNDPIMKLGGRSLKTKNARSVTPEGFAYSFYKANNFNDKTAEQRLREDYPWIYGATREALKAGMTEEEIRKIADSPPYYEYNDQDQATKIRHLLAKEVARRLTAEKEKPVNQNDLFGDVEVEKSKSLDELRTKLEKMDDGALKALMKGSSVPVGTKTRDEMIESLLGARDAADVLSGYDFQQDVAEAIGKGDISKEDVFRWVEAVSNKNTSNAASKEGFLSNLKILARWGAKSGAFSLPSDPKREAKPGEADMSQYHDRRELTVESIREEYPESAEATDEFIQYGIDIYNANEFLPASYVTGNAAVTAKSVRTGKVTGENLKHPDVIKHYWFEVIRGHDGKKVTLPDGSELTVGDTAVMNELRQKSVKAQEETTTEEQETGESEADMFGEMSDADFEALMEDVAPTPPPTQEEQAPKKKSLLDKRKKKPLNKIDITEKATIKETGEEVEISENADVLLSNANDRIGALKSLINCLSS